MADNENGTFFWGTVHDTSPLAIRRDGSDEPIGATPDALVMKDQLHKDDRVRCQLHKGRVIIYGVAGSQHPRYASGSTEIKPKDKDKATSKTISFPPGRFKEIPYVIATVNSSTPEKCHVGTKGESKNSANVYLTRTNTTKTKVKWIAMEKEN